MKNSKKVKQIIMGVLEDYVDKIIKSKEAPEAPLKSEATLKSEAPEKQEAKEAKEAKQAEPRINIDKMAQDNATNFLKFVKKKVSNYV